MSASGASPRALTWFLVAQGAVAGCAGSVLGICVGVVGMHLVPDRLLTEMASRVVEAPEVRLVDLVPVVAIGTVVAAAAAWLPGRSASRIPTLQALAGRRPLPAVPVHLPLLGVVALGIGCACLAMAVAGSDDGSGSSLWSVVAIVGGLALLAGVLASAPWLIAGLERSAHRLPDAWRLAGRSLARSRVRSSAVVGAVATVAAAVVAGGALYASDDHRPDVPYVRDDYVALNAHRPSMDAPWGSGAAEVPDDIVAQAAEIVGDADRVALRWLEATAQFVGSDSWGANWGVGTATPALLDELSVPPGARAALDRGDALAMVPEELDGRPVTITAGTGTAVEVPAVHLGEDQIAATMPRILVSDDTAERLGLTESEAYTDLILVADAPLSSDQRERLRLLAGDVWWDAVGDDLDGDAVVVDIAVPGGDAVSPTVVKAAILSAALLMVLAVLAVGLAMAAKDSDDERQVLAAVGAPPRTMRRIGARRAVLLALCAAVLAVPTGLLPAAAIVAARADDVRGYSFRPDLVAVGFVAVVVPLAAGAGAAVAGRVRDAVRPPRPDVFAFGD